MAPLLTQPRRLAVLVYLVLARPRGLHSRDTLVALLWPESDQGAGRHALRNVLHAIRHALGPDVIATAGDGMVGVNLDKIVCDAVELERDVVSGRVDEAVARYHGELLQGFHVTDAPEFERWLDGERRRLSDSVMSSAWASADEQRNAGKIESALQTARRAAAIAPDDEISLRRFVKFLDEAGDRFGAIRAYDEFAARLDREYGAKPAEETQRLARALREATAHSSRVPISTTSNRNAMPSAPAATALSEPTPPSLREPKRRDYLVRLAVLSSVVLLSVIAAMAIKRRSTSGPLPPTPARLVVLPMENATGDSSLGYIGAGLAEGIAKRLEGIGGITVRSGARGDWPAATRHDFKTIGKQFGSVILLKTVLGKVNDSLEVRASVLDLASSGERVVATRRFTTRYLHDMESDLAAAVAGAVFRAPLPNVPRQPAQPIDPESYRLMLAGWHQLLTVGNSLAAKELFLKATDADPLNARAWAGLSSALAGGGSGKTVGENTDEVEAAASRALALDSLQSGALANLGFARAMKYRNLADGLVWVRKAIQAEPSNPEVFLILGSLYRHAWMWDDAIDAMRIAERLDPLSPGYVSRQGVLELCADRPERAFHVYERELAMNSSDTVARKGLVTSLERLGRFDDAIAQWRLEAALVGDTAIFALLNGKRGREGYLEVKHFDGARRLRALQRPIIGREVQLQVMMQAHFSAGDVEAGYADLNKLSAQRSVTMYRLPCLPGLEEVKGSERFRRILAASGPLPKQ